ncbi:MAG: response regulator transcription factor [Candidatus Lindowbacteria bacterium]|nr:response regulator transcription factor [Candidatus Lindowbacteria bacterium]
MRILVVEDEDKVAKALKAGLEDERFEVVLAETGEDGFFLASSGAFDLIVLDIMLPRRSGLEILSALRQRQIATPVLLLTACDTIDDRVRGLDSGADDYLTKPFAFAELLARIRSLLRRGRPNDMLRFKCDDLELDLVTRKVIRDGTGIDLTPREFELLEYLLRQQGQIVSREMLARDIWRESHRGASLDNVIDVHIARLRQKIDQPEQPKLIHTVRGAGFVLRDTEP